MEQATALLADQELVDRSKQGDASSREELARACLKRVRRTVGLVMGLGSEADDISQTALMRVFASLESYRKESSFTTWVDKITVNTVREYMRRKSFLSFFRSCFDQIDSISAYSHSNPQKEVENKITIERLTEALLHIKPKKRMALVLSAAYGYTTQEIANLTGASTETVKKRLQHGRKELLESALMREHWKQALGGETKCLI